MKNPTEMDDLGVPWGAFFFFRKPPYIQLYLIQKECLRESVHHQLQVMHKSSGSLLYMGEEPLEPRLCPRTG